MGSSSFGSSLVLRTFEVNYILHLKLSGTSTTHSFVFLLPQENCVCLQLLLFFLILIWWVQKSIFPKSRQGLAMDATETFNQEYPRVTRKVGKQACHTEFLRTWNRSSSCVETGLIKSCIGGSCRPTGLSKAVPRPSLSEPQTNTSPVARHIKRLGL